MEYEQLELNLNNNNLVVQDNMFVHASYEMTSLEQKLLLILISTIKKDDTKTYRTVFRVRDIADLMNVSVEPLYRDLPKACKSLMKKIIEIKQPNGDWEMFNIITHAKYKKKEGSIMMKINEEIEPYLVQLQDLFTSFRLSNVLDLSSKHAIRIYQLSKSSLFKNEVSYTLEEFKKILKLTQKSYDRFNNISGKILNPSIDEINLKTDLNVEYEVLKLGTKAVGVKFYIKKKSENIIRLQNDSEKSVSKSKVKPNNFNNFDARDIYSDPKKMKSLEHKLLGWDNDKQEVAIDVEVK
jgi:plasmid replication initiation protein